MSNIALPGDQELQAHSDCGSMFTWYWCCITDVVVVVVEVAGCGRTSGNCYPAHWWWHAATAMLWQ